jgi:CHAT domain-containing protein/lipoprotein NlpI
MLTSNTKALVTAIFVLALLLAPVVSTKGQTPDEQAIRQTVLGLVSAWEQRDLARVVTFWSPQSEQLNEFRQTVASDIAEYNQTKFANFTFLSVKQVRDRAVVRVRFDLNANHIASNQPVSTPTTWDIGLLKEADSWHWFMQADPVRPFIEKLILTPPDQLRGLLQEQKNLITIRLIDAFVNMGNLAANQVKFDVALHLNEIAVAAAEVLNDRSKLAECYVSRGILFTYLPDYLSALEAFQKAGSLYRDLNDKRGAAKILMEIGIVQQETGALDEALKNFQASLAIMTALKDVEGEALAHGNLGNLYRLRGEYELALDQLQIALKIFRENQSKNHEAMALLNLAILERVTGRYDAALEHLQKSMEIYQAGGNKMAVAETQVNIGNVYQDKGNYGQALAIYEQSRQTWSEAGQKPKLALVLNNIGVLYQITGKFTEALEKFNTSLEIAIELKDVRSETVARVNIASLYHVIGNYDEALKQNLIALKLCLDSDNKVGEASVRSGLTNTYFALNRPHEALQQLELGLPLILKLKDKVAEANAWRSFAYVSIITGHHAETLLNLKKSLALVQSGNLESELVSQILLGVFHKNSKQWRLAAADFEKAIQLIEITRTRTSEPLLQTSFFQQYTEPYRDLVECLVALQSDQQQLFALSEKVKARTLISLMESAKVNVLKVASAKEREQEAELNSRLIAASERLSQAQQSENSEPQRVTALKSGLDQARAGYDEFRRRLFLAHPELQSQQAQFEPATLVKLNQSLFAAAPNLCLLSYLVLDDKTLLFIVTRGKDANSPAVLSMRILTNEKGQPFTSTELHRLVAQFRLVCAKDGGIYGPRARDLYKLLIAPAERQLAGKSHLVIIPDGILNTLPFQALIDGQNKHLIEGYSISYAPSATALVEMMKLGDQKRNTKTSLPMFAMGRRTFSEQAEYRNRELPWAEQLTTEVAKVFAVKPFVDADATRERAIAEMDKGRYVLLATHGELNELSPMYSAIILGKGQNDDGRLYARDLMDMNLQAELVVLAACDTGTGQQVSGEGIIGLTWALFVAGAPSGVATQWSIQADSTRELMLEFFSSLVRSNASSENYFVKATALQRAQLAMLHSTQYSHPYYWAPFVLMGDWR